MFSLGINLHCKIAYVDCFAGAADKVINSVRECSMTGCLQVALRKYYIDNMLTFFYLVRSWTIISTKLDNLKY